VSPAAFISYLDRPVPVPVAGRLVLVLGSPTPTLRQLMEVGLQNEDATLRFIGRRPTPYEFFPFGGGVRRCLGMAFALYEMKVVLATVLSHLELHSAPGYRMKLVRRSITFAPSEGMPVVVERRAA
jgi:hypothetical protein